MGMLLLHQEVGVGAEKDREAPGPCIRMILMYLRHAAGLICCGMD